MNINWMSWFILLVSLRFSYWIFTDNSLLSSILPFALVALLGPWTVRKYSSEFLFIAKTKSKKYSGFSAIKMLLIAQSFALGIFALFWICIWLYVAISSGAIRLDSLGVGGVHFASGLVGVLMSDVILCPIVWYIGMLSSVKINESKEDIPIQG